MMDTITIPVAVYRRQMQRARATQSYFVFFRDYGSILSKLEALFLQDLINRSQIQRDRSTKENPLVDGDEYFLCTLKYLSDKRYLRWSEYEQERLFPLLIKKGFVKVKHKIPDPNQGGGISKRRWVWINFIRIEQCLDELEGTAYAPVPPGEHTTVPPGANNSLSDLITVATQERSRQIGEKQMNGTGFWKDDKSPKKGDPIQIDFEFAMRLREITKRKSTIPYSRIGWSNQFRQLRQALNNDTQRIQKALDWYSKHIGKEYVPIIHSAQSFRMKFDSLEAAIARDLKDNPEVNISTDAQWLADNLGRLGWPKGSKSQLALVAELSLQGYTAFQKKAKAFTTKASLNKLTHISKSRMERYLKILERVRTHMLGAKDFVNWWLDVVVLDSIKGWEGWNGNLKPYAFHLRHKAFMKEARGWTQEYCGDPELWDKLADELEDANAS